MNEIENKEIEEMAKEIQKSVDGCAEYWATLIAKHLIEQGYRNVKNKVVLTEEDLRQMIRARRICVDNMAITTRKETAKEILKSFEYCNDQTFYEQWLKLAKEYGVEVKE